MCDVTGREIFSEVFISDEKEIAINDLKITTGLYFVIASSNNKIYKQKVMIR